MLIFNLEVYQCLTEIHILQFQYYKFDLWTPKKFKKENKQIFAITVCQHVGTILDGWTIN